MITKKEIMEEFPEFFKELKLTYFESPNGWNTIIYDLCKEIEECLMGSNKSIRFRQIKQKFGGLRVYYDYVNASDSDVAFISVLVQKAENRAAVTCEITGKEGFRVSKGGVGWLRVLCKEEAEKLGYK